ncbi:hypothetical protein [Flavobacterium johnsoniae]|uniref:hypothetical protein n=1 Tax=Flavobacterium johnsoniae TaxID=986 RepID=UPI0013F4FB5D|nr:hypothetical protein [Flavobacterium johnsoniae]
MKSLSKHIQESLNQKPIKDISKEKIVDEDTASFMRARPANDSALTRGTTKNKEK